MIVEYLYSYALRQKTVVEVTNFQHILSSTIFSSLIWTIVSGILVSRPSWKSTYFRDHIFQFYFWHRTKVVAGIFLSQSAESINNMILKQSTQFSTFQNVKNCVGGNVVNILGDWNFY